MTTIITIAPNGFVTVQVGADAHRSADGAEAAGLGCMGGLDGDAATSYFKIPLPRPRPKKREHDALGVQDLQGGRFRDRPAQGAEAESRDSQEGASAKVRGASWASVAAGDTAGVKVSRHAPQNNPRARARGEQSVADRNRSGYNQRRARGAQKVEARKQSAETQLAAAQVADPTRIISWGRSRVSQSMQTETLQPIRQEQAVQVELDTVGLVDAAVQTELSVDSIDAGVDVVRGEKQSKVLSTWSPSVPVIDLEESPLVQLGRSWHFDEVAGAGAEGLAGDLSTQAAVAILQAACKGSLVRQVVGLTRMDWIRENKFTLRYRQRSGPKVVLFRRQREGLGAEECILRVAELCDRFQLPRPHYFGFRQFTLCRRRRLFKELGPEDRDKFEGNRYIYQYQQDYIRKQTIECFRDFFHRLDDNYWQEIFRGV